MKGIYVINSLDGGGAERVFSQLIKLLSDDESLNHAIEVILLDYKEEKYQLPLRIKVHRINYETNKIILLWRYFSLIKNIRPTYVFSFLTRANSLNVAGSIIFGYQSIISERSDTNMRLGSNFLGQIKRTIVRFIYIKASCIVAVSAGVKNCLEKDYLIPSDKITVLYNPVDINYINEKSKCEVDNVSTPIIAMGRLVATKGFDTLIRAYAQSELKCGLQILGQGPELDQLQNLSIELGIREQVSFLGFQENPFGYLKNAFFFVLSSKLEGFPNALLEAMALGKAVVATDCSGRGPREIFKFDDLIPQGEKVCTQYGVITQVDDVEALSSAMLLIAKDNNARNTLEKYSLLRAQDFKIEHFYTNFQKILKKIKDKA